MFINSGIFSLINISAFYYVQSDLSKVKFGRVIFYHNFLDMKNKFDEGATYLHVEENLWCCIDEEWN